MNPTILLIILAIALTGHYVSQKLLLKKGWEADNPKPHIKRLMMNGGLLMVVAIASLAIAEKPYGLIGILLLIESAVGFAFAKKLRNKERG